MENGNYWSETQGPPSSRGEWWIPRPAIRRRSAATGSSDGWGRGDSDASTWPGTTTSIARSRSKYLTPSGSPAPAMSNPIWPRRVRWPSSTTRTSSRSTTWDGPTTASASSSRSTSTAATWPSRIGQSRPSFRESAELVAVVAEALHHAHTRGLVHRDVKPANILIDTLQSPWVADFGLALERRGLRQGSPPRRDALPT